MTYTRCPGGPCSTAEQDEPFPTTHIIIIVLAVLIVLLGSALFLRYVYHNCSVSKAWHAVGGGGPFPARIPTKETQSTLAPGSPSPSSPASLNNLELNILYVEQEIEEAIAEGRADNYEFSYGRLRLGKAIGEGAFGQVFVAQAYGIAGISGATTVAVKQLRMKANDLEKDDFLSEISMMKHVGCHPNVVAMLGCCTIQQPYCMVMEYVPHGDLLKYLRNLRRQYERETGRRIVTYTSELDNLIENEHHGHLDTHTPHLDTGGYPGVTLSDPGPSDPPGAHGGTPRDQPRQPTMVTADLVLDPKELQSFALQIAQGMHHLQQKGVTHRDLAARNVLVGEGKVLKISDFGLSREGIYVKTSGGRIPLRWLSVEAMRDNIYTPASDCWAFGVVLWEICTLGGFPYPTVSDRDLLCFLLKGNRLEKPHNCTTEIYTIMKQCWEHDPNLRPTFGELCEVLTKLNQEKHPYVNIDPKAKIVLPPIDEYCTMIE